MQSTQVVSQNRRAVRGTALLYGMIVTIMLAASTMLLMKTVIDHSHNETFYSNDFLRLNSGEIGLARARFMTGKHTDIETGDHWLQFWARTDAANPPGPYYFKNTPTRMRPVGPAVPMGTDTGNPVWEFAFKDGAGTARNYFDIPAGTENMAIPPRGTARVRTFVLEPTQSRRNPFAKSYILVVRSELDNNVKSLACMVSAHESFNKFVRFAQRDLGIGTDQLVDENGDPNFLKYDGNVHTNGDLELSGENNHFTKKVTAVGQVIGDENQIFDQSCEAGAPWIKPPTYGDVMAIGELLPGGQNYKPGATGSPYDGSIGVDHRNAEFIQQFTDRLDAERQAAIQRGDAWVPELFIPDANDKVGVRVEFNGKKMRMQVGVMAIDASGQPDPDRAFGYTVKGSNGSEWIDIPHNQMLYVNGHAEISGDMAGRCTVMSTKSVVVSGSLRYTNALANGTAGVGRYALTEYGNDHSEVDFNPVSREYTPSNPVEKWSVPPHDFNKPLVYKERDNWEQLRPTDDQGQPYEPCLGVVSVNHTYFDPTRKPDPTDSTYISNDQTTGQPLKVRNAEAHGFFFALGDHADTDGDPNTPDAVTLDAGFHVLDMYKLEHDRDNAGPNDPPGLERVDDLDGDLRVDVDDFNKYSEIHGQQELRKRGAWGWYDYGRRDADGDPDHEFAPQNLMIVGGLITTSGCQLMKNTALIYDERLVDDAPPHFPVIVRVPVYYGAWHEVGTTLVDAARQEYRLHDPDISSLPW